MNKPLIGQGKIGLHPLIENQRDGAVRADQVADRDRLRRAVAPLVAQILASLARDPAALRAAATPRGGLAAAIRLPLPVRPVPSFEAEGVEK